MNVILTHEQADFDAIASLLGAYLIDSSKIPLLPRKINRNVRAFLTLYGAELPFTEARDLPNEDIDAVTLVDTQSLTNIKGMLSNIKVTVVDHHPLRVDIPESWQFTIAALGANATIFVESLRDQDIELDPVHAILLLLGIYEDTGSLTYSRTTSRDLKAASFLLDQGASLNLLNDFLNHPLSDDQFRIYDQLRNNAEIFTIKGHRIVLAKADSMGTDEELSTVAHKLKDFFDPDALVILVLTRAGIQLIARSTSDDIDVSRVAHQFGGGGHERAAASLVKGGDLENVYSDLKKFLMEIIQPAIVVSQIMSRDPHLLEPFTSVQEAVSLMQRYGYEGFPVVKEGKVIGLLTRRAVDRAISHKLNLTAENLMEAGSISISPDDSIDTLQKVMTDTEWGQIPVVRPEDGKIVGIVTRTDLLKTMISGRRLPGRLKISNRINKALPPIRLALLKAVSSVAHDKHFSVFIVGGFVRDLMLNRPCVDFDFVVEGDAIAFAKSLAAEFGGRITSHARFRTAKWLISSTKGRLKSQIQKFIPEELDINIDDISLPDTLDFVTARTEFYTFPTALPVVEPGSIKLDLHRRDFTINTLALRLDGAHFGELYDYWGGLSDIKQKRVRVLHSLSFVDDPTRILRAVRFEQRFGFSIEKRTLQLIGDAIPLLDRVSGDRIRHELDTIFLEDSILKIFDRMDILGILRGIQPEFVWDDWLRAKMKSVLDFSLPERWIKSDNLETISGRELIYPVLLIRFSNTSIRKIIKRLRFSSQMSQLILGAKTLFDESIYYSDALPSEVVNWLDGKSMKSLCCLFLCSDRISIKEKIDMYIQKWSEIRAKADGHILRDMGIQPGPQYRKILSELRAAWLDGVVTTPEGEERLLQQLVNEVNGY